VNFVAGTGLVTLLSDTGSTINVQTALDPAVIQTRHGAQTGGALYCASTGGSGTTYRCSLAPALQGYVPGMVLHWRPDVNGAGGATTLEVDLLGAKAVRTADGAGNPGASDIAGGRLYAIWYDGTSFRLPAAGGGGGATSPGGSSGQVQFNNGGVFGGLSKTGTGEVASTVTLSTAGPVTVSAAGFYFNDSAGSMTYHLPAIAAGSIGARYCFRNAPARTGAITLQAPAATYIDLEGANGTAAGSLTSDGDAGDSACLVAIGLTQYAAYTGSGAWSNN
jgi:hypothetical protein